MKRAREGEDEDDGGAIPRAVDAAEEGEDEDATRAVCERVNAERAAIYGADARGEVSLKLECANNFKLSEAHELARWTLLPGEAKECVNPRWAFVRNKPLIDRVVIVLAPGLDHKRWCDEGATTCPRMKRVLRDGLKTMCESPTALGMTLCKSLLYSVRGKLSLIHISEPTRPY